jgi:hypothetical protein|tara:strand:- start:643 stop:1161 length:519 start_codon:yes stop_codon:yes gene_type:complete
MAISTFAKIGASLGSVLASEGIQKAGSYVYDSFLKEPIQSFKSTTVGGWYSDIFSSEGFTKTVGSIGGELVKTGLGLDPRRYDTTLPLATVKTGTDSFSARNKAGQIAGATAKLPLGNSGIIQTALDDVKVQDGLVSMLRSPGDQSIIVEKPNYQVSKMGRLGTKLKARKSK